MRDRDEDRCRQVASTCPCRAADSRVCFMIRWGERYGSNPRCSCACHQARVETYSGAVYWLPEPKEAPDA